METRPWSLARPTDMSQGITLKLFGHSRELGGGGRVDARCTQSTNGNGAHGPGWWMASDGNWYRPEQHPDYVASPEPAAKPGAAARGLPAATAAASAALSTASEAALEKVRRLGGMLDAGRLSDYEFQQMRKEILGL
jgi:hypothetical protein